MPITIFGVVKRSLVWLVLWIGGGNLLAYAIYQIGAGDCVRHLEVLIIICCVSAYTVGAILQKKYFRKVLKLADEDCDGDKRTFELDLNLGVISCIMSFVLFIVDFSPVINIKLAIIIIGSVNMVLLTTLGRRITADAMIYIYSASWEYVVKERLIIMEGILLTILIYLSGLLMPIKYLF